jgi:hypothetical protein
MKTSSSIIREVISALNQTEIPYVLVGAFARNYYADPRSTKDADIVISMDGQTLEPLVKLLGEEFRLERQMAFETNTGTLKNVLLHPQSGFTVELFGLSTDAHDQERFKRRRATSYEGLPTHVLTAEDYVITKLRWPRPKDSQDVRDVIAMQGDALDWNHIRHWAGTHGSSAKLEQLLASIPPLPVRADPA